MPRVQCEHFKNPASSYLNNQIRRGNLSFLKKYMDRTRFYIACRKSFITVWTNTNQVTHALTIGIKVLLSSTWHEGQVMYSCPFGTIFFYMKALVIGSVTLNQLISDDSFISKINQMNAKYGPFEFILGTLSMDSEDDSLWLRVMGHNKTHTLSAPVPLYLISGGYTWRVPQEVAIMLEENGGEMGQNIHYLGQQGVYKMTSGLHIAYLSGSYQQDTYSNLEPLLPIHQDAHQNPEVPPSHSLIPSLPNFQSKQIEALIQTVRNAPGIDILLSAEWPEGILKGSGLWTTNMPNKQIKQASPISDLALACKPRYHFASGQVFFEREPYKDPNANHVTRFIGLGSFGKERWFYALNIVPMSQMDPTALQQRPPNTTICPLVSYSDPKKRSMTQESNGAYFWGDAAGEARKRMRKNEDKIPPEGYLCNRCHQPGHWIRDCPEQPQRAPKGPSDSYICNKCKEPGHWIRDCPRQSIRKDLDRNPDECWFCLSNPNIEQHLVVTLGDELYLTLAKGPLTDNGHLILAPITHYHSRRVLQSLQGEQAATASSFLNELSKFNEMLDKAFEKEGMRRISFEVFGGWTYAGQRQDRKSWEGRQHMITHAVAIPEELVSMVKPFFIEAAQVEQLDIDETGALPDDVDSPYFYLELPCIDPDTDTIVHKSLTLTPNRTRTEQALSDLHEGRRKGQSWINLRFGSMVIADLLGTPDRADWKSCVKSKDEEKMITKEWRMKLENQ